MPSPTSATVGLSALGGGDVTGGIIVHTGDGGKNWNRQETPNGFIENLWGVAFPNNTHGWAVGDSGTILFTVDGGDTWNRQKSETDKRLYRVTFPDIKHGWAVGDSGTILFTVDGGDTWINQNSDSEQSLFGVAFPDISHGWAVGAGGTILAFLLPSTSCIYNKESDNQHSEIKQTHLSPVLEPSLHAKLIDNAFARAVALGKIEIPELISPPALVNGVFTLAQYQTGFREQKDRGTCWAFAGVAALEAAYRRKFGIGPELDMSEEYTFHMGKAFALGLDPSGFATSIENNSSTTGFQGSGDIVEKLSENAIPGEEVAHYIRTQQDLLNILPVLGYAANTAALHSQEDFDAIEFCEQHIPLVARVNARYRGTGWASIGKPPTVADIETTLLSNHEVVCDVQHLVPNIGGHVLLLIGFDRNRRVFFAKNHWGENRFIEIKYSNDPEWMIQTGYYIKDVVDPTFVQNEACWVGNWWLTASGQTSRLLIRRAEDFSNPGKPTKLGTLYAADGKHDVNGEFLNNGGTLRMFLGAANVPVKAGTLAGARIDAHLDFSNIYNLEGVDITGHTVSLSRFTTRFAAIWESTGGKPYQARHGLDRAAYQQVFDAQLANGFRPITLAGYSEGRSARFAGVWIPDDRSVAWESRHVLTADEYQAKFDSLTSQGYRLINVTGYAVNGAPRYTGIWERRGGPDWQAHHGMGWQQYQQKLTDLSAQGYVLTHISGYSVNGGVQFAGIWEKQSGVMWETLFGLTSSQYQKKFDEHLSAGMRPICVSGYTDSGIARYAAIWRQDSGSSWQARHGVDGVHYQAAFDQFNAEGMRPVQISGYGDGFYPA